MSVELLFCGTTFCQEKNVDWLDWLMELPLKYSDMKNRVHHTSGYVIYDEKVITDFWNIFFTSPFKPYNKFVRLEIKFDNVWFADGFGYE